MSEWLVYSSLFGSSFLSATLFPGSSEAVLVALIIAGKSSVAVLVLVAVLGNTLGGLTNIVIGRLLPVRQQGRWYNTALSWLRAMGPVALLFSWLPLIGDVLCILAGWLRFSWLPTLFFLSVGKTLRYIAIAAATLQGVQWWH